MFRNGKIEEIKFVNKVCGVYSLCKCNEKKCNSTPWVVFVLFSFCEFDI